MWPGEIHPSLRLSSLNTDTTRLIHPSLQKLIVSLRTAVVIDDWKLDKQQTSHDDILDSFRLACLNYDIPRTI